MGSKARKFDVLWTESTDCIVTVEGLSAEEVRKRFLDGEIEQDNSAFCEGGVVDGSLRVIPYDEESVQSVRLDR